MNNAEFEEYYRAQKLIPDEEWPAFLETLRTPLPITFRINGSGKFAFELREKFENDFFAKFQSGAIMVCVVVAVAAARALSAAAAAAATRSARPPKPTPTPTHKKKPTKKHKKN